MIWKLSGRRSADLPALSIVLVCHDMARELPRTLASLRPGYQRGIEPTALEVIVVDSGSQTPVPAGLVQKCGLNGKVVRLPQAPFTLARAVNFGLSQARGDVVGVLLDGARLASPGLLHTALQLVTADPRRLVVAPGWELGFDLQRHSGPAYSAELEDRLLAAIDWQRDGYRLFDIAVPDPDTPLGWPGPLHAAAFPVLSRRNWERLAGADEGFDARIGGHLARDLLQRALALPDVEPIVVPTEATFHQVHGGLLTSGDAAASAELEHRWAAQYRSLRGDEPRPLDPSRACTWNGPSRSPAPIVLGARQAGLPGHVRSALLQLIRDERAAGRRDAALGAARLARQHAPEDIDLLQELRTAFLTTGRDAPASAATMALANAYLILGAADRAQGLFQQLADADPQQVEARLALTRLRFPGPHYLDVLDQIHSRLRPQVYLEIGVAWGASISKARSPTIAIGVDPAPRPSCDLLAETHIFSETSDAFFAARRIEQVTSQPPDLVFIDGLHIFEQVLKDFINVERLCSPRSVVLLHDTAPLDERTQTRSVDTAFHTGDVWKVLMCLRRYRPDLEIVTLPAAPTGLTIVRGLNPASTVLAERYEEAVAAFVDWPYADFAREMAANINLRSIDLSTELAGAGAGQ